MKPPDSAPRRDTPASIHRSPRPAVLAPAARRRLSNQIERAFRGTYGAKTGLRTLVCTMAGDLLARGATSDAVAKSFEECVFEHSADPAATPRAVVAGQASSATLVALIRECVSTVVLEREPVTRG